MFNSRQYQSGQRDELLAFAAAHPWVPAWPMAQIEAFLDRLISGPAQVLDVWSADDAASRLAVAVLLDQVSNPCRHACLEFLGLTKGAGSPELYRFLLTQAQALLRPADRGIQLAPAPLLGLTAELLAELGAEHYYDMYEMVCEAPGQLPGHVPDPRVHELTLADFEEYYALLSVAFAENPDASLSDLASAREAYALGGSRIWLIREQGQAVAFLNLIPEAGEVRTLGVAPVARGRGLAKALLGHALAWLAAEDMAPAKLSVAVRNQRALQLYLQMGFSVSETSSCWVLPVAEKHTGIS